MTVRSGKLGSCVVSRLLILGRSALLSRVLSVAVGSLWVMLLSAQDLDLVLYAGDPEKRSVIDQIEDPEERDAFKELRETTDSATKRALAEAFIERFPQSWLVSFAYAMAAQACIALDDLQAGLEHGRRSLRILPENSTVLVALANVQVHGGLLDEAERSATDALEYLSRFRRPSLYTKSEWARIERELQASSYFVLGRVAATRGLRASGAERSVLLEKARDSLHTSLGLNSDDGIAVFLLGIVEEALANKEAALSAFAKVARLPGPVQARAFSKLRDSHQTSGSTASFHQFRSDIAPLRLRKAEPAERAGIRSGAAGLYAGSDACRDCHQEVFSSWSKTGMAKMFRPYEHGNVIGDFAEREYHDSSGELLSRMFVEDGRHYFELPAGEGKQRFRVDYTIGSKWQQAYATRLPNGRIHVVPLQYNVLHGKWVNFWEVLDDGASERSRIRNFHQMKSSTSYQVHCAPCHTSQVQAEGSLLAPERITFRESGINCEMCHGPSWSHVVAMQEGRPEPADTGVPPLRFGSLDHRAYVDVCAQCHMQSGIVETGPRGEINYSGRQDTFLNSRRQRPYEEYSRTAFYKDGRFRETTFIVESFVRTQCFRQGKAHCGHCHDPHPADSAQNPKSLKFLENSDQMCLQCHGAYASSQSAHTGHVADSEASRCVSCHMPKIMNSMMFMAGTHRIDDIPDAAMTERFGPEDSPNACLACHQDKSADWLARSLADWPPQGQIRPD